MNKLKVLALSASLLLSGYSYADVIGGTIELAYWKGNYDGNMVSKGTDISVNNELQFDDTDALEVTVSFEHPVPVLPNVKIRHIDLDETENGELDDITFNGETFPNNADVTSNLDLSHTDLILYYEVLDNIVSLDLGLDIKRFDGQLDIIEDDDPDTRSTTKIDETLPMLFGSVEVELPFTGLALGGELSIVSYDGDSLSDARVRLRQNMSIAFIELGYRQFSIDVEDVSNVDVDADISGVYLSTGLDF